MCFSVNLMWFSCVLIIIIYTLDLSPSLQAICENWSKDSTPGELFSRWIVARISSGEMSSGDNSGVVRKPIFGMLNSEKIRHEHLIDLFTIPVRCSHFTLGSSKKVIFNSMIYAYFRLFTLSLKKTNCNCDYDLTAFWITYSFCCTLFPVLAFSVSTFRSFPLPAVYRTLTVASYFTSTLSR